MFVKICGTTNLPDAELAVELGADALGFIFAPSKRHVTLEEAASITRFLPSHVERVGVFGAPEAEEIARTVRDAHLHAAQMHWRYDATAVGAVRAAVGDRIRLWQVVGFEVDPRDQEEAERDFTQRLRAAMLDGRLSVVLLDAVKGGASGGLGETFSWGRAGAILNSARMAAAQAEQARGVALPRIMLAGGLNAENVQEAVAAIRPSGVDVVSGVEARPGVKSQDRMRSFTEAARAAEESFPPLR